MIHYAPPPALSRRKISSRDRSRKDPSLRRGVRPRHLKGRQPVCGQPADGEAADLGTLNKRVHQIMTRKPVTIGPNESIVAAARKISMKTSPVCRSSRNPGNWWDYHASRLAKQFLV